VNNPVVDTCSGPSLSTTASNACENAPTKADMKPATPIYDVDCVFCNFPWGENIFEYHKEVDDILYQLGKDLRPGCVCAFVTKQPLDDKLLVQAGFTVDCVVPVSGEQGSQRKAKKNGNVEQPGRKMSVVEQQGGAAKSRTSCYVTFASRT
jgi:hypothetical protein